jgi:hypothetical protein
MRPHTLADAVRRIRSGAAQDVALAEFVDHFDLAASPTDRYASLADEPASGADPNLDALVGAIAEYLAKLHRLGKVPPWASQPHRRLPQPWFTTPNAPDGMREYLTFASPAEFASRNIFTDERPLRRARSEVACNPDRQGSNSR